jgi:hypothetical protein
MLALAIGAAREDGVVRSVALALIDNSERREDRGRSDRASARSASATRAFNCISCTDTRTSATASRTTSCCNGTGADYQLVLNPDVDVAPMR